MKYKIIGAYKTFCRPDWGWRNDGTPQNAFVLWLIMGGHGQAVGDFGKMELRPGMCILWRCREKHLATHDPQNPIIVPWITFEHVDDDDNAYYPKKIPPRVRIIENWDFLAELMQHSIEAHLTGHCEEAQYWLGASLREIGNYDMASHGSGKFTKHYESIETACHLIMENPFERFTLEQLADRANLSVDHFIRMFKKSKGITPGEFMLRHRMQTACDLLKFTNHSITEISEMMSYPNIYSFSRQFSERTGQSPSNFRNSH